MTGRGDGSVIGGRLGLMIDPNLLRNLAAGREIALVSGTNGKTTTTRLTAAAMGVLGDVATNSLGANMPSGHTSALARAGGTPFAVLEVDEHYLPEVLTATKPKVVALLNLSRDQLDRAKEVAMIADLWRRTLVEHPVQVVANADDPMVTWAARAAGESVTWVAAGQRWHDDSWVCPECGSHIARTNEAPATTLTTAAGGAPAPVVDATNGDSATDGQAAVELVIRPVDPNASDVDPLAGDNPIANPHRAAVGDQTLDGQTAPTVPAARPATPGAFGSTDVAAVVDEMTLLTPTVPVPDATHPAGRPGGARVDGTPVLAPIAGPETVPVSATSDGRPRDVGSPDSDDSGTFLIATNNGLITGVIPAGVEPPAEGVPGLAGTATTDVDDWWCTNCSLRRPAPQWRVAGDAVIDPDGRAHVVTLQLPGRVNRANAATALAVAAEFGVDPALATPHLAEVASVAGRYAQVERDGRYIRLLLAKNPAGWLEAFDMADDAPTLLSINSRGPDGLDTSWLFDVDFSPLRGRTVLITGERAYDLAVRLETGGIPFAHVDSFDEALRAVPAGRVEVIANYTAFQDIRAELDRVT